MAVKVTDVPWQHEFVDATMLTETGAAGKTVIVMGLEVAEFGLAQERLEITVQVTWALFDGLLIEKAESFVQLQRRGLILLENGFIHPTRVGLALSDSLALI